MASYARLLQDARRSAHRHGRRDKEGVSQARSQASSRCRRRRGEVQRAERGLRGLKRREEARALRPVRHGEREPDPPGMGRRPRLQRRGHLRRRWGRRLRRQLGRHSGEHSPRRRCVRGATGTSAAVLAASLPRPRTRPGHERDAERDVRRGLQRRREARDRARSRQERVRHAHTVKVPGRRRGRRPRAPQGQGRLRAKTAVRRATC